jgi:hypothetical protein
MRSGESEKRQVFWPVLEGNCTVFTAVEGGGVAPVGLIGLCMMCRLWEAVATNGESGHWGDSDQKTKAAANKRGGLCAQDGCDFKAPQKVQSHSSNSVVQREGGL